MLKKQINSLQNIIVYLFNFTKKQKLTGFVRKMSGITSLATLF